MASIVTVAARLKGAIVELIALSYDRNLSRKCGGLSQGASVDRKRRDRLFLVQTDTLQPVNRLA